MITLPLCVELIIHYLTFAGHEYTRDDLFESHIFSEELDEYRELVETESESIATAEKLGWRFDATCLDVRLAVNEQIDYKVNEFVYTVEHDYVPKLMEDLESYCDSEDPEDKKFVEFLGKHDENSLERICTHYCYAIYIASHGWSDEDNAIASLDYDSITDLIWYYTKLLGNYAIPEHQYEGPLC